MKIKMVHKGNGIYQSVQELQAGHYTGFEVIEDEKEKEPYTYFGFTKPEMKKILDFINKEPLNAYVVANDIKPPKFIPTDKELKDWGFEETTWKTYFANKDKTILYSSTENKLREYKGDNNIEIPFTTREDFMKAIGVEEKEEDIHINFYKSLSDGQRYYLGAMFSLDNVNSLSETLKEFYRESKPNVSDFKITYVPSEELLRELGFTNNAVNCNLWVLYSLADEQNYESVTYHIDKRCLQLQTDVSNIVHRKYFYLRSGAELRMIVEVLRRREG